MFDEATEYARAVQTGAVVAGPHVRAAAARHIDDLERGAERGLYWDLTAADRFLRFCRSVLRLSEGQFDGKPFDPQPSQAFILGSLFGWKRADGTRRFRRAYIEEGKGNGKSPMVGAIGLYGLVADGESGAQIYSAGATKEQAGILFRDAVSMVGRSPALASAVTSSGGPGREFNLAHLKSQSFFRPVSRETKKTGSGPRPHFALCDELHEHPDGGVIEILERGFKFRRQPLLVMITNSGTDRQSVCWAERKHAAAVAAQQIEDDTTFSYICALDDGDDPLADPSCWIKANPLLNVTISEEYLAGVAKQARDLPGKRNGILRLHFCVWTDAETAWIEREAWKAIEDPDLRLEDYAGQRCVAGLDLSATRDMTARALVFDDGADEEGRPKYAAFVKGYLPEGTLNELAMKDGQHWAEWAETEHLEVFAGKVIRLDEVSREMVDIAQRFELDTLAYDTWNFRNFVQHLDDAGVALPIVQHPQGWNRSKDSGLSMPSSIDALETLILEKRIRVQFNPLLGYAAFSAVFLESPAGLRRFAKEKAGKSRIDALVALTMAVGAAVAVDPEESGSIYDDTEALARALAG
ncbi:MAG TPA: terminase TerL endonuclease subunit [Caulobacterales bacterium]|nr:terminase TerL endonuclease subunit [Caulobacterales bacterium]